jgi:hypothetical protein
MLYGRVWVNSVRLGLRPLSHTQVAWRVSYSESQSDGQCNSSNKNENSRRQTNREVFASTAYSVRGYCGSRG